MADQQELFGLVASVPTCWRMLKEVAAGGARAQGRRDRICTKAAARLTVPEAIPIIAPTPHGSLGP